MPSQAYLSAVNARVNADRIVTLFEIHHADLDPGEFPDGILLTNLGTDVVSNGVTYLSFPFKWRRPHKRHNSLPGVPVQFGNVDKRITIALKPLQGTPTVTIKTVMESSPDTVEEGPFELKVKEIKVSRDTLTAELGFSPMLWMKFGRRTFNPADFPGAFR